MNFEFIPSSNNPYGFTIKPPVEGYWPYKEEIFYDTKYLLLSFKKDDVPRALRYLFDKHRNHISWQMRAEESKDYLEVREYDDSDGVVVRIERRISIDLQSYESGVEGWEYKTFVNDDWYSTSDSVLEVSFEDKYKNYLRDKAGKTRREEYRRSAVEAIESLGSEADRKEYIGRLTIQSMDAFIFSGGLRGAGPLETIHYTEFASKLREFETDRIDAYYIHALTIMALYMNDGECYKNVDVAEFVKDEATKHGKAEAYGRYFDRSVELGELQGLGLC